MSPAKKKKIQDHTRNYTTMFPLRTTPPLRSTRITPLLLTEPRSRNSPRRPRGALHPRAHRLQCHRAHRRCVFACVHGHVGRLLTYPRQSGGSVAGHDRACRCWECICDLAVADHDVAVGADWVCLLAVRENAGLLLSVGI